MYKMNKLLMGTLMSAALFGTISLPQASAEAANVKYVKSSTLEIRAKASSSSKSLGRLRKGDKVTVYHVKGSWATIKKDKKVCYVSAKYLSSKKIKVNTSGQTDPGKCIVSYAKKFIGNPYRYGGTSLTKGTDCSGFTKSVYAQFGFALPRSSSSQRKVGRAVSWDKKQPGDIICYSGHVAIYMGGNKIIHASNPRSGIKVSKYIKFRPVLSIRRIIS